MNLLLVLLQWHWHTIYSVCIVTVLFLLRWTFSHLIKNNAEKLEFSRARRKLALRITSTVLYLVGGISLAFVWGVDKHQLVFFTSSVLAVLGVAFVAQWSILSNITASLILFFNHPLKTSDRLEVMDKDMPIRGTVTDITAFFIHIKQDDGDIVAIPNNVFIQKGIKLLRKQDSAA